MCFEMGHSAGCLCGNRKMNTIKCLNCGHIITDETIEKDELGLYVICKECGSSTDI